MSNVTDLDSPYQTAGALFSGRATQATARRLRRTRQHLSSYRHDLMIAMRVVNSVEREMMKAEWENWLLDENTRCRQLQIMMLRDHRTTAIQQGTDSQQVLEVNDRERKGQLDKLRTWQDEYCGSCQLEQEMLLDGRKHLTFG